jgi:hypothetical protein
MRRIFPYLILALIVILSSLVLWKSVGMLTIYKHYDGPLYVVVAKTFYHPQAIEKLHLEMNLSNKYFAAHLPLYPGLIRLISLIRPIGELRYLKSMVLVNLFSTIGLALFFYYFLWKFKITQNPLLLASVLLFLPRFLVIRTVGAPESLFLLLILLSIFFFEKSKFWLAGLFGGLATMTKSPGILLFGGYCLVFAERLFLSFRANRSNSNKEIASTHSVPRNEVSISWNWLGILLIPLGLLTVFGIYAIQYKDFFAYFHSGDNIHLVFPYSVFNFQKPWVGTAWLEEIIFYYFIYGLTVYTLKKSKFRSLFYFGLVYFIATLFIQHRDISRYSLPLWPLSLIAFEKLFTSKKFYIVFLILLPAIFLYAWNFLTYNVMPIANWAPFM